MTKKKIVSIACLVLLFIIIKLPSVIEPVWVFDEGIYSAIGHFLLVHGNILYANAWDNKPPSIYYLFMVSRMFWGYSIVPLRIFLLLLEAGECALVYKLVRFWFPVSSWVYAATSVGILLLFFFFDGNIVNGEVLFMFFSIASLYISRKFEHTSLFLMLLAGLCMGIGISIKITAACDMAAFIAAFLMIAQTKALNKIVFYISGIITPLLLYGLYFLIQNHFGDYLNALLYSNKDYVAAYNTTSLIHINSFYIHIFFLFVSLAILYVIRKKFHPVMLFLIIWIIFACFSTLISARPYFHYLMQLALPVSLLSVVLWMKIKWKTFLFVFFLFLFSLYFYRNGAYFFTYASMQQKVASYWNTYSYLVGKQTENQYVSSFSIAQSISTYDLLSITAYINSLKKQSIFIWGDVPWLYATVKADPQCTFTSRYYIDSSLLPQTTECIIKHKPQIIVDQDGKNYAFLSSNDERYYMLSKNFPHLHLSIYIRR